MARITLDLNKFKRSGIYILEFDTSESITLTSQTIRLVVGFSRTGPFNAPVYLQDIKTAKKIFGDVDALLERRGSYFHRSLFACLKLGPVFALNLMPLNNGQDANFPVDKVDFRSFSIDVNENNGPVSQNLYSSFFNKQRFWNPDADALQAVVDATPINKDKLLSFVNLSQKPMSILVTKSNLKRFNTTANEWFGAGQVPDYIRPYDYIADYFLDVVLVEGNWNDYAKLSIDPVFSSYFDAHGIKKDRLDAFLSSSYVKTIGSFTGTIIPDLVDGDGKNHFIETIINNAIAATGLLCTVNRDMLDDYAASTYNVDLIGHGLVSTVLGGNQSVVDFLSYSMPIRQDYQFANKSTFTEKEFTGLDFPTVSLESAFLGGDNGYFENVLVINKSDANAAGLAEVKANVVAGKTLIKGLNGVTPVNLTVQSINETATSIRIGYSHPTKASEGTKLSNVTISGLVLPLGSAKGTISVIGDFTNGTAELLQNDVILVQKSGLRKYYTVDSVALSGAYTVITVKETDFNGIDQTCVVSSGTKAKVNVPLGVTFIYSPDKLVLNSAVTPSEYVVYPSHTLYHSIETGSIKNSDKIHDTADKFIYTFKSVDTDGVAVIKIKVYEDLNLSSQVTAPAFDTTFDSDGVQVDGLNIISLAAKLNTSHSVLSFNPSKTEITVESTVGSLVRVGDFVVAEDTETPGEYHLTKVIDAKKVYDANSNTFNYVLKTNEPVWINAGQLMKFSPIDEFAQTYRFTALKGFQMNAFHMPGDSNNEAAQLAKILGVLDPANSNLFNTLASKDVISFRYIIDTFDGGVGAGSFPKNLLTKLAGKRQKCLAIMNAPSMKKFIKSNDPLFTDAPDAATGNYQPVLNTKYIVDGGNLSLGPSFRYSLPSEEDGAKHAGFFGPFLVARTGGKNTLVPPAAYVSNLFIKKFLVGTPYAIVAGSRRGIIDDAEIVGLEYDFLDEDRDNLEPFGINPIVFRKGKGIMIYANQSSYQKTTSSYNSLHVRDLLITVEDALEDILGNYTFEFNDASTRLQIKSIVETYLSNVQSDGGIYTYSVQMDEKNNTPELIGSSFGLIDIVIEPEMGMHKVIGRLTVTKTGGISSGGFSLS